MVREALVALALLGGGVAHASSSVEPDAVCHAVVFPLEEPRTPVVAQAPSVLDMHFSAVLPNRESSPSVHQAGAAVSAPKEWHLIPTGLQAVLAEHIAKTWDLQVSYAREVVDAACAAAKVSAVDPLLILAVAARETAFRHVGNPGGRGSDPHQPYGIMQVFGKWHADKFAGRVVRETSMPENVVLGAKVLKEYLERAKGDETQALLRYVGAKSGTGTWYSDKVLVYRDNFRALVSSFGASSKK